MRDGALRLFGRAAQFRREIGLRRQRARRLGFDRLELAALDLWRLDPRRNLGMRSVDLMLRGMHRTRPDHRARQQHLRPALMVEIAIGKAEARDRAAKTLLVLLVEIEAGVERHPLDR